MPGTEGEEPEPPKASDKPTKTCFLDLPAELRNVIYELAFEGPLDCYFPEASKETKKSRSKCPALLMASKQIHKEAVMMFYSKAAFHFDSRARMTTWLRKIGAKKRNMLSNVVCEEPAHKYNHNKLMEYHMMLERGLRDRGVGLKPCALRTRANDDPDTKRYVYGIERGEFGNFNFGLEVFERDEFGVLVEVFC